MLAISPTGQTAPVPGIPSGIAGLVFHRGTLYASVVGQRGGKIIAYTGWNGKRFTAARTIFDARRTVGSVNGLAWGPDGRLYAGAGLTGEEFDKHGKPARPSFPHAYTVFSIKPDGRDFRVLARGLRQPWQLTFASGSRYPFVSVLSQEVGQIPPDAIVHAKPGQNYGFPWCFAGVGIACGGGKFAKPLITLPEHSSPMGIQAVGTQLYVALFNGIGKSGPEVVRIPAKAGGKPTPVLTGFVAPLVALGNSGGYLYTGDLSGSIYKVAL